MTNEGETMDQATMPAKLLRGDRVRMKAEKVSSYIKPFRSYFEEGRLATIIYEYGQGRVLIRIDSKKRQTANSDFTLEVNVADLERAP
jgi:hypothetical protein